MELKEFTERLQDEVETLLGSGHSTVIRTFYKNNIGKVSALNIMDGKENGMTPNFYLGPLFQHFQKSGETIKQAAENVVLHYRKSMAENGKYGVLQGITQEGWIRERLIFRLVRRKGNEEMLQETAHITFLDMALAYYILVQEDENGMASIRVDKQLFREFGWDGEKMRGEVMENTMRLLPARVCTLPEALRGKAEGENAGMEMAGEGVGENIPLVITNKTWINGAVAAFYPRLLRKIAQEHDKKLILLPSSIHEFIVCFDDGETDMGQLKEMVGHVNHTSVLPEDILSENVYCYDLGKDRLCNGIMCLAMQ